MKYNELVGQLADANARLELMDAENSELRESVFPLRTEVAELKATIMATEAALVELPGLRVRVEELIVDQREKARQIDSLEYSVTQVSMHRDTLQGRLDADRRSRWLNLRDHVFAGLVRRSEAPLEVLHRGAVRAANVAYGGLDPIEEVGVALTPAPASQAATAE